ENCWKLLNRMFLRPVQCAHLIGSWRWVQRLLTPRGNHDGWIGNRGEYRFVAEINDAPQPSVRGHEQAQVFAILGAIPLVGSNERQRALWLEQLDRAFVEIDEQICRSCVALVFVNIL